MRAARSPREGVEVTRVLATTRLGSGCGPKEMVTS